VTVKTKTSLGITAVWLGLFGILLFGGFQFNNWPEDSWENVLGVGLVAAAAFVTGLIFYWCHPRAPSVRGKQSPFWERWLRGFGLTILAAFILGVAWGIPQGIGKLIAQDEALPEWVRTLLLIVWLGFMLMLCPVIFEWLARKVGFAQKDTAVAIPPSQASGQVMLPVRTGGPTEIKGIARIEAEHAGPAAGVGS
jgi:peptidoglycan biosynthesis protein MviN/MurJ (putative lipid II flippase)